MRNNSGKLQLRSEIGLRGVLVSVLLPVYNGSQYVKQCLDSVYSQSLKDFEVIVVNDGSKDDTRSILREYEGRATIVDQEHRGISKSANRAIELARGEYVCFISHDDWWDTRKLELEYDIIKNSDAGVVYSDYHEVLQDALGGTVFREKKLLEYDREALRQTCYVSTSSSMIRKSYLDRLSSQDGYCFDESLRSAMDWDLWIRLSKFCSFRHLCLPLSYYRIHPGQTIRSWSHFRDAKKVYERYNGFSWHYYADSFLLPLCMSRGQIAVQILSRKQPGLGQGLKRVWRRIRLRTVARLGW